MQECESRTITCEKCESNYVAKNQNIHGELICDIIRIIREVANQIVFQINIIWQIFLKRWANIFDHFGQKFRQVRAKFFDT